MVRSVPELPGCASAGDTEEAAIKNAREALELWFEPSSEPIPAGAKVFEVALQGANDFQSATAKKLFVSCADTVSTM
jgi:hypothetical protein